MNYAVLNVKSLEQILFGNSVFTLVCITYRFKFNQIYCVCNEVLQGSSGNKYASHKDSDYPIVLCI